jgi:hypothetical protein
MSVRGWMAARGCHEDLAPGGLELDTGSPRHVSLNAGRA